MSARKQHSKDIFKSSLFCKLDKCYDTTIVSEDGVEFEAHKHILSKRSGYFHTLYRTDVGKKKETVILDFDGEVVDDILIFLYTGEVNLHDLNVANVLVAADYLLMDELVSRCKDFALLNTSFECCVPLLTALELSDRLGIVECCYRLMLIHFRNVINDERSNIAELPLGIFKRLINDDSLGVTDEKFVWKAILMWVEGNEKERTKNIPELLSRIRWNFDNKWLMSCVAEHLSYNDNDASDIGKTVQMLKCEVQKFTQTSYFRKRCPKIMYVVIFKKEVYFPDAILEIYLTYDRQLDIWRKIGETRVNFTNFISMDKYVFMFNRFANKIMAFDLIKKSWVEKHNLGIPRTNYCVAQSQTKIFAVGGLLFSFSPQLTAVERYDPTTDSWSYCAPIPLINVHGVSVINEILYVVGYMEHSNRFRMRVLAYNIVSDVWSDVNTPKQFRSNFGTVAVSGKLCVFGGIAEDCKTLTSVEAYRVEKDEWELLPDLPFPYEKPHAIILNETPVIFDHCPGDGLPPCTWNEDSQKWEVDNIFSKFSEIHRYEFCSINDQSVLWELTKENRDPETTWAKSPFFTN